MDYPGDHVGGVEVRKEDTGASFGPGLIVGLLLGGFAALIGSEIYHEQHPPKRAPAPIVLSNTGTIHGKGGYAVVIGPIRLRNNFSDSDTTKAFAPAWAKAAPNDKPFGVSCMMIDAKGQLVGGGGGYPITRLNGVLLTFDVVAARPANVRCTIKPGEQP